MSFPPEKGNLVNIIIVHGLDPRVREDDGKEKLRMTGNEKGRGRVKIEMKDNDRERVRIKIE